MLLVLRRLWIQITADRKRFSILCAMLVLGFLLWGRIIVTSDLPRTAVADGSQLAAGGLGGQGGMSTSDRPPRPPVRVELPREPIRDPLLISDKHFPKPTSDGRLPEDGAKSQGDAAEREQRAEARLIGQLRELVGRFKLEAVMQGRPMAVINGRRYRLYDWVPVIDNDQFRFELVEVGHRSVVLEYEGRQFELKMEFPGTEER